MSRDFTLTLTDKSLASFQRLKEKTEITDDTALVVYALNCFELFTEEAVKGGRIFVRRRDGSEVEVELF